MNKWINANDRLPEKESIVWIPDDDDITLGFIFKGRWMTYHALSSSKVTKWMEFPPLEEWNKIENGYPKEMGWYFTLIPRDDGELPVIWKTLYTGHDFIAWDNYDVWDLNTRGISYWIPLPEPPEENYEHA